MLGDMLGGGKLLGKYGDDFAKFAKKYGEKILSKIDDAGKFIWNVGGELVGKFFKGSGDEIAEFALRSSDEVGEVVAKNFDEAGEFIAENRSLADQANDLIPINQNRNRVTLRSEKIQMDVDLSGAPHAGIDTPHTKISQRNFQAPENLQPAYNTSTGKATYRNATQADIRTVRRYLTSQGR
jgi:hypothetical protein